MILSSRRGVHILALDSVRHYSCCGKIPYKNMELALEEMDLILIRYGQDGEPLGAYYCVFCNHHHIGRRPKPTTLKWVQDIEVLLRYDFESPCKLCEYDPRTIKTMGQSASRTKRVEALLPVLRDMQIEDPAHLTLSDWKVICGRAGVKAKAPSETTLAEIKQRMAENS